uniref:Uncharacterized protein n=1 Tax=Setaria italica TaxID=4555 RepID=K3Y096_SETIT
MYAGLHEHQARAPTSTVKDPICLDLQRLHLICSSPWSNFLIHQWTWGNREEKGRGSRHTGGGARQVQHFAGGGRRRCEHVIEKFFTRVWPQRTGVYTAGSER